MRIIMNFLAIAIGFTFSVGTASALTCGGVECGEQDVLIASELLPNSGDATVEAWIESEVLYDVELAGDVLGSAAALVDGSTDLVYASLPTSGGIFVIKVGEGAGITTSGDSHFLYSNLQELTYAIISMSEIGLKNIGAISHYTAVVPLPAAAWLLISALIGLFAVGRVRRSGTAA